MADWHDGGYENDEATRIRRPGTFVDQFANIISALVKATPSPNLTISQQQIEQIHKNGAPQTIKALEDSPDPLKDPDVTCSICSSPYHTEFEPGVIE